MDGSVAGIVRRWPDAIVHVGDPSVGSNETEAERVWYDGAQQDAADFDRLELRLPFVDHHCGIK